MVMNANTGERETIPSHNDLLLMTLPDLLYSRTTSTVFTHVMNPAWTFVFEHCFS